MTKEQEVEAVTLSSAENVSSSKELSENFGTDDLLKFQTQLWGLLEKQVKLYTSGESSSVPELTAHRLLSSICFTLDIDLDDLDPSRVQQLLAQNMQALFATKQKELAKRTSQLHELWQKVVSSTPLLESVALKDTLESIEQFAQGYRYRYFAHEIPSDIDYPLCHPVSEELLGIRYMEEYLGRLLVENAFMQRFKLDRCHRLLKKIHPEYRVLLINLYEPVAVNAIGVALAKGCEIEQEQRHRGSRNANDVVLAEGSIDRLTVPPDMLNEIEKRLAGKSTEEISRMLEQAAVLVCEHFDITDESEQAYLGSVVDDLVPRVIKACQTKSLPGIFLAM